MPVSAPIPFVKMHGLGNDFVVLDAFDPTLRLAGDMGALARAMCERRTGVGADQLLLLSAPSDQARTAGAAARMRVWNADGGESEMCGNGIRCVASLAVRRERVAAPGGALIMQTGAGLLRCVVRAAETSAEMGAPTFGIEAVGAVASLLTPGARPDEFRLGGVEGVLVGVGNPHLVVFLDESPDHIDIQTLGPRLEHHAAFPRRINVQFAQASSPSLAVVRTWERGAGVTSACGTGACAVLAAGARTGRLSRDATIRLAGGDLRVRWEDLPGTLIQTGPATLAFDGVWPASASNP